jgi:hypothetical protein
VGTISGRWFRPRPDHRFDSGTFGYGLIAVPRLEYRGQIEGGDYCSPRERLEKESDEAGHDPAPQSRTHRKIALVTLTPLIPTIA